MAPPLPHNRDAERAVLGAILLDNAALSFVRAVGLAAADFFIAANRRIFAAMEGLAAGGKPVEEIVLAEVLTDDLEVGAAGGTAYIAKLADGLPRVNNVGQYARIVREKSELRALAHGGDAITQAALERGAKVEDVRARVGELLKSQHSNNSRLCVVSAAELVTMELKAREMILAPILPTQGLAMIYSKRGVGKTWVGLGIAYAVATGSKFLRWEAPKPRRILFVDGELPATTLQSRLGEIVASSDQSSEQLPTETLRFVTPDFQSEPMPDLATNEGQRRIESLLQDTELLILDNLSALCRSGKENEGESWLPVQEFALRLRQQGIAVLFVHHAGKGGAQRGTSRREDVLDLVIALRHPQDYLPTEGLRAEVHFEKCRALLGDEATPFEVRLQADPKKHLVWTIRAIEDVLGARAAELFAEGLSVRDVAKELAISKSKAQRLKGKLGRTGDSE